MLIEMFTGAMTGSALNSNDFVTRVANDGLMLDQNKNLPTEPLSATKLSPDVFASLEQVMRPNIDGDNNDFEP